MKFRKSYDKETGLFTSSKDAKLEKLEKKARAKREAEKEVFYGTRKAKLFGQGYRD